jgi:hypothetical protein
VHCLRPSVVEYTTTPEDTGHEGCAKTDHDILPDSRRGLNISLTLLEPLAALTFSSS